MSILKWSLAAVVLVTASQRASAETPIGAGGQIQQIPPAPVEQNAVPQIPIPPAQPVAIPVAAGTSFEVKALRITGQTQFSQTELIAVADFEPGHRLTLPDLHAMTARITSFYNQRGYFVARAYLPPQDITDGVVTIAVIEGHYGEIALRNQAHVSDVVLMDVIGGLNRGDTVETGPLERRLLIMSDIPGIAVNATLSPGTAVGTSDLTIGVKPGPFITGDVQADNWGNPYTGTYRVGGTINWNEPLGIGDVLSLRTLESTDGGMDYLRASYQAQAGDATVGVALTGFKYHLGKQFTPLDANGSEEIASIYASYPVIRSYDVNLNVTGEFDERFFQDNIGATGTTTDKRASVIIAGINGDEVDRFWGGGETDYSVAVTLGDLDIETPWAREEDALTARTNGGYAKLSASLSRLQELYGPLSLFGSIQGQIASKNLDISEQMELGGAQEVRAYPEGEAYGDEGYVATLEPRLLLPKWQALPGRMQLIAFVDTGFVRVDTNPFSDAPNNLTRSGAGVGINWYDTNDFLITAAYSHMLGNTPATSYPDRSGEYWIQITKFF